MSAFLFVLEIVYNLILCENNIRDIYCQLCINTLKNLWCVQNGMAVDNNMNTPSQSLILFCFAQSLVGLLDAADSSICGICCQYIWQPQIN